MPIPLETRPAPASADCEGLELRWLELVDGEPACHHTLRATAPRADHLLRRAQLPRWTATRAPWASALTWSSEVRPRVLRNTDAASQRLGVTDTAPALVVVERGSDASGVIVEHELTVLAAYADQALR
jgi:hypothetical protein